jgi:hypothetical protein
MTFTLTDAQNRIQKLETLLGLYAEALAILSQKTAHFVTKGQLNRVLSTNQREEADLDAKIAAIEASIILLNEGPQ